MILDSISVRDGRYIKHVNAPRFSDCGIRIDYDPCIPRNEIWFVDGERSQKVCLVLTKKPEPEVRG